MILPKTAMLSTILAGLLAVALIPGIHANEEQKIAGGIRSRKRGEEEPAKKLQVRDAPFAIGALEYDDFYDADSKHTGDCGSGPVDSKIFSDSVCAARGGECAVGWTSAGEWLQYDFIMQSAESIDITIRLSSHLSSKQIAVDLDGSELVTWHGPGQGWDVFIDRKVKSVSLGAGNHKLKLRFITGQINVCSVGINSVTKQSELRGVPFAIGATQYTDFYDRSNEHIGNCGSGPVDSITFKDDICGNRGGQCGIGFTSAGEWLMYDFTMEDAGNIDITIRLASLSSSKKIAIDLDGSELATWRAPGQGWNDFLDRKVKGVPLGAGDHQLMLRFIDGYTNVCAISVDYSVPGTAPTASPPTASPPTSSSSDVFRLKMYHEQGYFWQCDGVCDDSDPSKDNDPKWCLECDGTTCQENEYAKLHKCDSSPTSSGNTLFEFEPTSTKGEVRIRAVGSNVCLTYDEDYKDKSMNVRMKTCGGSRQKWWTGGDGEFSGSKFEIKPENVSNYCLTQQHHPLDDEDARLEKCSFARNDDTSLWLKYYV